MLSILFGTVPLWHVVSMFSHHWSRSYLRGCLAQDGITPVRLLDTYHMMRPFLCFRLVCLLVCASLLSQQTTHTRLAHLRAPVALPMQIANSSILCVSSVTGIFSRRPSQAAPPVRWHGYSRAPWVLPYWGLCESRRLLRWHRTR